MATLTTLKVPAVEGVVVTFMTLTPEAATAAALTTVALTLLPPRLGVEAAKMDLLLRLTRRPCSAAVVLEELLLLLLLSLPDDGAGDDDSREGGRGCCCCECSPCCCCCDTTAASGLSGLKMVELAEVAGTQEIFSLMAATNRDASLEGISMFNTVVFREDC